LVISFFGGVSFLGDLVVGFFATSFFVAVVAAAFVAFVCFFGDSTSLEKEK